MIRLNKNQMVIDKAEYKELKANSDSWLAEQEKKKAKPAPSKTPNKPSDKPKSTFGGAK